MWWLTQKSTEAVYGGSIAHKCMVNEVGMHRNKWPCRLKDSTYTSTPTLLKPIADTPSWSAAEGQSGRG